VTDPRDGAPAPDPTPAPGVESYDLTVNGRRHEVPQAWLG
jgi:hypothetical protein